MLNLWRVLIATMFCFFFLAVSSNVNGINGQVNYQRTSWKCFLILSHLVNCLKKERLTELDIQGNEKSLQRWLDHELEVMVNIHEVRCEYEKQSQVYVLYLVQSQCCLSIHRDKETKLIFVLACFLICRRAALAEELAVLRQVDEFASKGLSPPRQKNGFSRCCIMFLPSI